MDRFFIEKEQIQGNEIIIEGADVKHISGALRLEVQDELEVVCEGIIYLCEIMEIDKKEIVLKKLEEKTGVNEALTKITLYQGVAKGSRMDYILQKGTEIGITEFVVVETERSVVKIGDDKKKASKLDRWQKIADEAGKQCKRDILPKVRDIISFKNMIKELEGKENILIPYEEEKQVSLKETLRELNGDNINIIIGPEGGFERKEVEEVLRIGGKSITLGPRILRTETAGLVTAAIVLYEKGDI